MLSLEIPQDYKTRLPQLLQLRARRRGERVYGAPSLLFLEGCWMCGRCRHFFRLLPLVMRVLNSWCLSECAVHGRDAYF